MAANKLAIVGGGWFGCHIAMVLKSRGIPFDLFESRARLFDGASGYNQNRLHLGFHYPRSALTRKQSQAGFAEFMRAYPFLTAAIERNLYAICEGESLLDFDTYCAVMHSETLEFQAVNPKDYGLKNVEGGILCAERRILTNKAREFFTEALAETLRLGCAYEYSSEYGAEINCTYQTWRPEFAASIRYEPCATLIYEAYCDQPAITLMDGPFYSVYPFEKKTSTLYSVRHSRLAKYPTYNQARYRLAEVSKAEIAKLRETMEAEVRKYYPAFLDLYQFAGWHGAVRSCQVDASDARVCSVIKDGSRMVHVMSGKIDSIFHAEREVLKCLGYS